MHTTLQYCSFQYEHKRNVFHRTDEKRPAAHTSYKHVFTAEASDFPSDT